MFNANSIFSNIKHSLQVHTSHNLCISPITTIFFIFFSLFDQAIECFIISRFLDLELLLNYGWCLLEIYCSAHLLNSLFDFSCFTPSEITDQCTTVYKADPVLAQSSALSLQSIKLFSNWGVYLLRNQGVGF